MDENRNGFVDAREAARNGLALDHNGSQNGAPTKAAVALGDFIAGLKSTPCDGVQDERMALACLNLHVLTGAVGFGGAARGGAARGAVGAIPHGLTAAQFAELAVKLRSGAQQYGNDMVVQGSRAAGTARADSDIDIAIRVTPEKFEELIAQRFGRPNVGSAKERTMLHAINTGKIQAGEAGLHPLRRELEALLGMDVDVSIIRIGGAFDNPPFIGVP
jgi:hypothetical protein